MANTAQNRHADAGTTQEYEVTAYGDPGPLQQRFSGTVDRPPAPGPEQEVDVEHEGVAYATLGMLDGTIVARLQCHESLGRAVLGRGSLSDIRLHDPYVHRIHAEMHWDPETRSHVITHTGGANGTFVNMQRIEAPTRLNDGARVRVGKTELIYRRFWYPGVA